MELARYCVAKLTVVGFFQLLGGVVLVFRKGFLHPGHCVGPPSIVFPMPDVMVFHKKTTESVWGCAVLSVVVIPKLETRKNSVFDKGTTVGIQYDKVGVSWLLCLCLH